MLDRDLEKMMRTLTNRLNQLSVEQRDIALASSEASEQLNRRQERAETRNANQEREIPPACIRGDRIIIVNSRRKNEKRGTVTKIEGDKIYFRFDSGRLTWRLKHNTRALIDIVLPIVRMATKKCDQNAEVKCVRTKFGKKSEE